MNIQVLCYQNFVWVTLFHYYFVLVNVITDLMFICLKVIRSNSYTEKNIFLLFLMFVFVYVQKDKLSYRCTWTREFQ